MSAPDRSTPVDVGTAFQLWWAVAGFGIAHLVCALADAYGQRDQFVDQLAADLAGRDPEMALSRETTELLLYASFGIAVVLGLIVAALVLVIAYQMRRGRAWARTVLTILGVFLVMLAVPALFGLGVATGLPAVLSGALAILEGVAAAGAIVLMHRRDSNAYFLGRPPG